MKIVICGGHLTPALSVIESLAKEDSAFYFGRKFALEGDRATSFEYKSITELGIPFFEINTGRYQREFTKYTITSLLKIPGGIFDSFIKLLKVRPDVVVGFGGYVSLPVCFAARTLNIPIVIHEQTMEAGSANLLISKIAQKICVSFETSEKFFDKRKIVHTGNPIRKDLFSSKKVNKFQLIKPVIYITGGSLGSHAINLLVGEQLEKLLKKYSIIHQTGEAQEFRDFEKLEEIKKGLDEGLKNKYMISKHFKTEEVGEILRISDMVIARSGINTVSELIAFKKPAILIPLPVSQKNEQLKNAQFIKKLGLGEVLEQKDISQDSFLELIDRIMMNLKNYQLKDKQEYFSKNSAKKIVQVIYAAAKNSN